jgi:protein TonB
VNVTVIAAALLAALAAAPAAALEEARFVTRVNPKYPLDAYRRKIQGCVLIAFSVTPEGRGDGYLVLKSVPKGVFDRVALESLAQSSFEPGDGKTRYSTAFNFYPDKRRRHDEKRCRDEARNI